MKNVSVKKETYMNIGRENENIEFKRSVSETKEGIASIRSMLNKHGKGILFFLALRTTVMLLIRKSERIL